MKPFLKWAGGKTQLVDTLLPIIMSRLTLGGRYVEPFLGGGAVALSLPAAYQVIASDSCAPLVQTWESVRDHLDSVVEHLRGHDVAHSKEHYYLTREEFNKPKALWSGADAAQFIYLNKSGFNGLYRVNKGGAVNVPFGARKRPALPSEMELAAVRQRMREWWWPIGCHDFEATIELAREGDVVYADPPYDGTFSYGVDFSVEDRVRLSKALRRAARRGACVMMTDAATLRVQALYAWADVQPISERRRVAANGDRSAAACVLAVR